MQQISPCLEHCIALLTELSHKSTIFVALLTARTQELLKLHRLRWEYPRLFLQTETSHSSRNGDCCSLPSRHCWGARHWCWQLGKMPMPRVLLPVVGRGGVLGLRSRVCSRSSHQQLVPRPAGGQWGCSPPALAGRSASQAALWGKLPAEAWLWRRTRG